MTDAYIYIQEERRARGTLALGLYHLMRRKSPLCSAVNHDPRWYFDWCKLDYLFLFVCYAVLFSLSVGRLVCRQDNTEITERISPTLGWRMGPGQEKTPFSFGCGSR